MDPLDSQDKLEQLVLLDLLDGMETVGHLVVQDHRELLDPLVSLEIVDLPDHVETQGILVPLVCPDRWVPKVHQE